MRYAEGKVREIPSVRRIQHAIWAFRCRGLFEKKTKEASRSYSSLQLTTGTETGTSALQVPEDSANNVSFRMGSSQSLR